jgi:GC-rich sequence DNA-binding factor
VLRYSYACHVLCSPKLASLVEYVTSLTRLVEKQRNGGKSIEDSFGLARRVKVVLVKLNEYDRAWQLAKHFQLKEAL